MKRIVLLFVFSIAIVTLMSCQDMKKDVVELKKFEETADTGASGTYLLVSEEVDAVGGGADDGDDADADVQLKVVEPDAFKGQYLTALTAEHIPPGTTEIQAGAFEDNDLRELTNLPDGLQSIGVGAFRYHKLTTLVIPASVQSVGKDAFRGKTDITKVTITRELYETIQAAGTAAGSASCEKMGLIDVFGPRSKTFAEHDGTPLAYPAK